MFSSRSCAGAVIAWVVLVVALVVAGCETPAQFEVRSLTIMPSEVSAGEEAIVTGEVRNNGGAQGTYDAVLTVDGSEVDATSVTVAADASVTVTFTLVRDAPGSYPVGLGEMESTLVVTEAAEPEPEEEVEVSEQEVDESERHTAKIEITFDRDTVFCKDGEWRWQVTLTEVNGFGVHLTNIAMELHGEEGVIRSWNDEGWLEAVGHYLSATGSVGSHRLVFCQQSATHVLFIVSGVDTAGHPIVAEGRINLSQQPGSGNPAAIEISFDPDSAVCKDNKYIWKTLLKEINGVGVHLREITREAYIHDSLDDTKTIDNESNQWNGRFLRELFPPDAYLSAFGSLDFKGGFPYGSVTKQYTHCVFTVIGIDDDGNEIRAEGRIDFIQ